MSPNVFSSNLSNGAGSRVCLPNPPEGGPADCLFGLTLLVDTSFSPTSNNPKEKDLLNLWLGSSALL